MITGDGRRFDTDAVASNADVVNTYKQLLGHEERGRDEAKRLSGKRFSMSLFVIHFGLKRRREHLQHHTVCFGPRYRELIDEIFKRETLADDFSLYLHAPCVTDPSLAPEGCASHYVLAPVPHLGAADIDWAEEGPKYRDRIFEYLERHYMPGLRGDLVTHRIFTPQDFRDSSTPIWARRFRWSRSHPERLVPPAQPRRRDSQPLYRRRRHSPGCRRAEGRRFGKATAGLMLDFMLKGQAG